MSKSLYQAHLDYLAKQKRTVPQPKTGFALIDTGATRSGVDDVVISQLGVNPVGITTVLTAGGAKQQNLYPAHFRFPGESLEIEFNSVLGVNLKGQQFNNQPIIALLGRDILSRMLLIYNGPAGMFTISF